MSIEAIAILISGAGIVATCGIETWLVTRQIRASEVINREQLRVQSEALESQFMFQKNEARRARILNNRRDSMDIIRELDEKLHELPRSPEKYDFYTLIGNTSLAFVLTDLCRDLENGSDIHNNFLKVVNEASRGDASMNAQDLVTDLMADIAQGTERALQELEKSL